MILQYTTFFLLILLFVRAQAPWPGAVPLAIRSPHFNCWLPATGSLSGHAEPTYWNNRALGWLGSIRIDGVPWDWFGNYNSAAFLVNITTTPTRTILTIEAGPMELEVTFLSPIEPTDLVRQSFPFTYMYLTANATDGANHSVQVYSDITAEWVSGDSGSEVTWSTTTSDDLVYHQVQLASPSPMLELNDQAEDATIYYAMANGPTMTWQTGSDVVVRSQFQNSFPGGLLNTEDTNFRAISDNWPVFGLALDLGNISEISTPVVWALGVVRDPVISYGSGDGTTQPRSSFFWTQYETIGDAIGAFVIDFPNALQRAIELDQKITSDALSISQDYADLVSLSARQTMGGIDITTSNGTDGQWNTSDIMIFMKSIDDSSRTNPTEFMFAAFPAYLYLNASWAGFLLRSSLQQQAATVPASTYAMPDLGSTYPIALGNNSVASTEILGIESSGDMIIMALAHAKASGDGSLISSYYTLLKSWANYLVANAPNQTMFISSDGQNNPNLAIKGIIGIRAMGEISQIVGQADDASKFKDQASTMLRNWESQAILSDHIISTYGQSASWGLIYNLFSDRLLKLDFIDPGIYSNQTAFYATQIPTAGNYGIAYDSNVPDQAKSHWTMLTAATTTDDNTRDDLLSLVRSRAWLNNDTSQFPTDYNAVSGTGTNGRSSPAQGAMFAFLALNLPEQSIQASVPAGGGGNSKRNVGAIIGGTLGGVTVISLAGLCLLLRKYRQKHKAQTPIPNPDPFASYLDTPATRDTFNFHSLHKDDLTFYSQHMEHFTFDSPTPSVLSPQRRESSLDQNFHMHGTQTYGPPNTNEPSPILVSPTSAFPQDSWSALRGAKMQTLTPLRFHSATPSTHDLRNEAEILRREMEGIRARQNYSGEVRSQYRQSIRSRFSAW